MSPDILIGIGVFLTALGTIFSGFGAYLASQEQNKTQAQQIKYQQQIIDKTEENATLSKKNAELSEEITGLVSGGDSYCHLECSNLSDGGFEMIIVTHGKYPMYDVQISIIDYQEVYEEKRKGNQTTDPYLKARKTFPLGNLNSNKAATLLSYKNAHRYEKLSFSAEIFARNGDFTQFIKLIKINGKWKHAYRLVEKKKGNIVYEVIDTDFPKKENGEINWHDNDPFSNKISSN